jgi:hypothetical protein
MTVPKERRERDPDYEHELVGPEAAGPEGFRGITPAMILDDAQALDDGLKAVVAAGGRVVAEPADRPWGCAPRTSPTRRTTSGNSALCRSRPRD